ncbi:unnamed protein product [Prunus armeniaca]
MDHNIWVTVWDVGDYGWSPDDTTVETKLTKNGVPVLECSIHGVNCGSAENVRLNSWRWFPIDGFMRGHLNGRMVGSIIPPFGSWEPCGPASGFIPCKTRQIMLKGTIQDLSLAIGLGMLCRVVTKLGPL